MMLSEDPDLAKKAAIYDKKDTGDRPGKGIAERNRIDIGFSRHDKHDP